MTYKRQIHVAPEKRLAMTFRLQQARAILQMPQLELSQLIREEIDKNPLLEEIGSSKKKAPEIEIAAPDSLYDRLFSQIREHFSLPQEKHIAEKLLEFLDEKGFLSTPFEEISKTIQEPIFRVQSIVKVLQTFEPAGIFACNLQESLLIQLKAQGEDASPSFHLVKDHFKDLIHGRYSAIKKKVANLDLAEAIQKLASLNLRPLESCHREIVQTIIPDLVLSQTKQGWSVGINEEDFPKFRIHSEYESIETHSLEEKATLRLWLNQGKWLLHSLKRRKKILLQIGTYLMRYQSEYFAQKGNLKPLTLSDLSSEFQLHESTLSRAISGKYAETPKGIIPLKSLLTSSNESVDSKRLLQDLIEQENKQNPLTDEEISLELEKRGCKTARRTISKYRKELKIRSASARKHVH